MPIIRLLTFVFAICLFATQHSTAQVHPITVASIQVEIGGVGTRDYHHGFAAGDKVIVSCRATSQKPNARLNVSYLTSTTPVVSRELSEATSTCTLSIGSKSILTIEVDNKSFRKVTCEVNIERIPQSEATVSFNTAVVTKTFRDTSYYFVDSAYALADTFDVVPVSQMQTFVVNSINNKYIQGGRTRITCPLRVPRNTVRLIYTVAPYRDAAKTKQVADQFNLLGKVAGLAAGGVAGAKMGEFLASSISSPPIGDHCDVFLVDSENAQLFLNETGFKVFDQRVNFSGGNLDLPFNRRLDQPYTYHLCIRNNDQMQGINVAIEAVAIVSTPRQAIVKVKRMKVLEREMLVNAD
jgi:hypothetical protein